MKTTTNYGLKKPDGTDLVNIEDLNANADTIDGKLKALEDGKAASSHTHNYAGSSSAGGAATSALACTGNAATATKLATARTIGLSGGATATATSFNGSANITIPVTGLDVSKANAGTLPIARGGTGATTAAATLINLGLTATAAELNYCDGVTSNIQAQLNAKQATITGAATTIATSNLTVSRALVSDTNGKVVVSAVTSTELGYLDGVTSNIQTQLNSKASKSTMVTATLAASSWSGTAAPYTYNLTVSGVTTSKNVVVGLGTNATAEQYEASIDAQLHTYSQGTNSITIRAFGDKPLVNLPINILII